MTTKPSPELLRALHAAQDATLEANRTGASLDEVKRLLKIEYALTAEVRMIRSGLRRRPVPTGRVECPRCGGIGGAAQWPGYVCFECEGLGHVED